MPRRMWLAILLIATLAGPAGATMIVSVNNAGTTDHYIEVDEGVPLTFNVDINIDVDPEVILSAQLKLEMSQAGVLEINSGSYDTAWDPRFAYPVPAGPVDTISGWVGSIPYVEPPRLTGDLLLMTMEVHIPATAPAGIHYLNATSIHAGDADTFQNMTGVPGDAFVIRVIPEPAALSLLTLGVVGLVARRRRR